MLPELFALLDYSAIVRDLNQQRSAMLQHQSPAGPTWMNAGHRGEGAHICERNVGSMLRRGQATCVYEQRGPGRERTSTGCSSSLSGVELLYVTKRSTVRAWIRCWIISLPLWIHRPYSKSVSASSSRVCFVCLLNKKNLLLCIFILAWSFTDMLVSLEA